MNHLLQTLTFITAPAAGSLLAAAWEGIVLAALIAAFLRLCPGIPASVRSVLWASVFMVIVLLHFVRFGSGHAFSGASLHVEGWHLKAWHIDPRWSIAVAGVWIALSLFRL